ncbi:hypothetical protein X943_001779 [Babesia divergens]|uniref:Uncharacterized protein n=1 Tax=Babesia divergens TaxID=32595 RepID=A0AAD9LGE9_BABDI|nr:hypothetical protein X943_001779 [Babesia divergens]
MEDHVDRGVPNVSHRDDNAHTFLPEQLHTLQRVVMYFAHSGTFCVVPLTTHQLFGAKNFTHIFSTLNTARATAGVTAFILSLTRQSQLRYWVPGLNSLLSLCSLMVVNFMGE